MSNEFQIIFDGQALDGFTVDQVKQNIARLYKTEVSSIERLFTGKTVVIKDSLDEPTAIKYAAAFRQQGARCEVRRKVPVSEQLPVESPVPSPQTNIDPTNIASKCSVELSEYVGEMSEVSIAQAGSTIVEFKQSEAPDINTDALSVAQVGETIVEHEAVPDADINTDALSLSSDYK